MTPSIGEEPARPATGPPARPPRQSRIESPFAAPPEPAPASVVASMWVWIGSGIIPVAGLVFALTRFTEVRERLREAARTADPSASAEAINRAAGLTASAALLGLAVPVIAQIVFALFMVNGRGWARYLLILVALIQLPVAVLAFGALSDEAAQMQDYLEIGIGVLAAAVLVAIVLMFSPGARRWFAGRRRGVGR